MKKIFTFIFVGMAVVGAIGLAVMSIFFLNKDTKDANSNRTAAARAARWKERTSENGQGEQKDAELTITNNDEEKA